MSIKRLTTLRYNKELHRKIKKFGKAGLNYVESILASYCVMKIIYGNVDLNKRYPHGEAPIGLLH